MNARPRQWLPAALLVWVSCCPPGYPGPRTLPADFPLPGVVYGGAGGGEERSERRRLGYYPVVMVPTLNRDHTDWTGANPGSGALPGTGSVYSRFREAGFLPIELWMINFSRPGEEMSSIEEATDDLKYFICAVMEYTGTDKVQILAHGTGCLLSRLTILKYQIAHWIESEVYIAGPFHGYSPAPPPGLALRGYPNSWALSPRSDLLKEIGQRGESPDFLHPVTGEIFNLRTMTIRNGLAGGDKKFIDNPDSPALRGAVNIMLPGYDHDGLRSSRAAAAVYIPFLSRSARTYDPAEDRDGDGFRGREFGGPDCDDDDPAIFPCAPEIPGDGIDQDCTGHDISPRRGRDGLIPLPPLKSRD